MVSYNPVGNSMAVPFGVQLRETNTNSQNVALPTPETPTSIGSLESIDSQFQSETDSELGTPVPSLKESLSSETFIAHLCKTLEKAKDLPVTVSIDADDSYVTVNQSSSPVPTDEIKLVSYRRTATPPADDPESRRNLEQSQCSSSDPSSSTSTDQSGTLNASSHSSQTEDFSGSLHEYTQMGGISQALHAGLPRAVNETQGNQSSFSCEPIQGDKKMIGKTTLTENTPSRRRNQQTYNVSDPISSQPDSCKIYFDSLKTGSKKRPPVDPKVLMDKRSNNFSVPYIESKSKLKESPKPFLKGLKTTNQPPSFLRERPLKSRYFKNNVISTNENKDLEIESAKMKPSVSYSLKENVGLQKRSKAAMSDSQSNASQPVLHLNPSCLASNFLATTHDSPRNTAPPPPVRKSSLGEIAPPIPPRPRMPEQVDAPPIPNLPAMSNLVANVTVPPPPPPRQYLLTSGATIERKKDPPLAPPRSASLLRGTPPLSQTSKQTSPISTPRTSLTPDRTTERSSFIKDRSSSPFGLLDSVPEEAPNSKDSSAVQILTGESHPDAGNTVVQESNVNTQSNFVEINASKNLDIYSNTLTSSVPVPSYFDITLSCSNSNTLDLSTADIITEASSTANHELPEMSAGTDVNNRETAPVSDPPPPPLPPSESKTSLISVSPYGKVVVDRVDLPLPEAEDEVRKSVMSAMDWGWLSSNHPVISIYRQTQPLIQKGPQCGLVALQMASEAFGTPVELEKILKTAQDMQISRHGEMFSTEDFCRLSDTILPSLKTEITDPSKLTPRDVFEILSKGKFILAPYDAHKNHMPTKCRGHRAHWALICGCLMQCPNFKTDQWSDTVQQDHQMTKLFHYQLGAKEEKKLAFDEDTSILLLWRQGKSRGLIMSSLEEFSESNGQLMEYPEAEDYIIESVVDGLQSKSIILSPR